MIEAGFDQRDIAPHVRLVPLAGGGFARRFGADPRVMGEAELDLFGAVLRLPDWARRLAPSEPAAARFAAPSRLAEEARSPAPSPLARTLGLGRYRRGEIIHRLLQLLPDIAPADRAAPPPRACWPASSTSPTSSAPRWRPRRLPCWTTRASPRCSARARAPRSRSRGPRPACPAASPSPAASTGWWCEPARVLVADFKTNRPAPDTVEAADPAYVRQMALYWALLGEVFPGRRVEAALIWTDGPKLMPIPENLLRRALDEMGG